MACSLCMISYASLTIIVNYLDITQNIIIYFGFFDI